MAAEGGSVWEGAGAESGLQVWRIMQLVPVAVEKEFHGQFFVGDSYVVLHTKIGRRTEYNIHFWLGTETTQDESTAAAVFAVELDEFLGGSPKQHRECQNHESELFLSYFRASGGVEYLPGGTASGFNHVQPTELPTRLLHIKGRRNVRMTQVPLAVASLNHGDVFILDHAGNIFVWFGKDSNRKEQAKGLQVANRLRSGRSDAPTNCTLLKGDEGDEFWTVLGGTYADVADADEAGSDNKADDTVSVDVTLHKIAEDGTEPVERVDGNLTRDMLDHESGYFLSTPGHVFLWLGNRAPKGLRKTGLKSSGAFLESVGQPTATVSREIDGGETPVFKEFFHVFDPPVSLSVADRVGTQEAKREDNLTAMSKPGQAPSERQVDDGSGTLTIWYLNGMDVHELPKDMYGQFFAQNSYVLKYEYTNSRGRPDCLVYFWIGRRAAVEEKGAAAAHTVRISRENRNAPQIRVAQGKEPAHFCSLFKGRMVIHKAAYGGESKGDAPDAVRLYHVKGTDTSATKASQVEAAATSLNSSDCYVLITDASATAWHGKHATEDEVATAAAIAELLKGERELVDVAEGEEPEAFWESLGGKAEYPDEGVVGVGAAEPRLFQVTTAGSSLHASEIYNFTQDDLDPSDVFVLDTWNQLFVWVGSGATDEEHEGALASAQRLIDDVADGRDPETPIIQVEQGHEPDMFTANFLGWDHDAAEAWEDPYERRLKELKAAAEASGDFLSDARSRLKKTKKPAAADAAAGKAEEEEEAKAAPAAPAKQFVDPLEARRKAKEAEEQSGASFLKDARARLKKTGKV